MMQEKMSGAHAVAELGPSAMCLLLTHELRRLEGLVGVGTHHQLDRPATSRVRPCRTLFSTPASDYMWRVD